MRLTFFAALASIAVAASLSCVAPARAQTFGFEGQTATSTPTSSPGSYTTLTETQGGVTLTLARESGSHFDVIAVPSGVFPASIGARALDPFSNTTGNAFIGNFSTTLSGVSINFGDRDTDADVFTLQAFSGLNGSGTMVGSTLVNYGTGTLPGNLGSASLSGLSGFRSIRFIGGSGGVSFAPLGGPNNSMYYDNINVTPVPEPGEVATWSALGLTLTLGVVRGRRRQIGKA